MKYVLTLSCRDWLDSRMRGSPVLAPLQLPLRRLPGGFSGTRSRFSCNRVPSLLDAVATRIQACGLRSQVVGAFAGRHRHCYASAGLRGSVAPTSFAPIGERPSIVQTIDIVFAVY